MTVAIYQSYSNNNYSLFKTTLQNHIDYCNIHGYSLILDNIPYSKFIDTDKLYNIACSYSLVVTIGSDCIFTNLSKPIEDFLDKDKDAGFCIEGDTSSYINGEINLFRCSAVDKGLFDFLKEEQTKDPNAFWGSQTIISNLVSSKRLPDYVQLLQPGTIQSYKSWDHPNFKTLDSLYGWKRGDFICHCIGGDNLDKEVRCKEVLNILDTTSLLLITRCSRPYNLSQMWDCIKTIPIPFKWVILTAKKDNVDLSQFTVDDPRVFKVENLISEKGDSADRHNVYCMNQVLFDNRFNDCKYTYVLDDDNIVKVKEICEVVEKYDDPFIINMLDKAIWGVELDPRNITKDHCIGYIDFANMLVRTDTLKSIGGYYFKIKSGAEDGETALKLIESGYNPVYSNISIGYHNKLR